MNLERGYRPSGLEALPMWFLQRKNFKRATQISRLVLKHGTQSTHKETGMKRFSYTGSLPNGEEVEIRLFDTTGTGVWYKIRRDRNVNNNLKIIHHTTYLGNPLDEELKIGIRDGMLQVYDEYVDRQKNPFPIRVIRSGDKYLEGVAGTPYPSFNYNNMRHALSKAHELMSLALKVLKYQ